MKPVFWMLLAAASTCTVHLTPARAWDAGGHMISAQIAFNTMRPETRAKVEALTKNLVDLRADKNARPYDFVTSAAWMDDVKPSKKRDALSSWHYVDAECGENPDDVTEQNGLDALKLARIVLRSPEADDKIKAEWLAIAIHVIGDLHQPLHAIARDKGGNDYLISGVLGLDLRNRADGKPVDNQTPLIGDNAPKYARLHPLWDFGYRYDVQNGKIVLLYDIGFSEKPDLVRVQNEANAMDVERRLTVLEAPIAGQLPSPTDLNPTQWARESSQIACDFAFSTPERQTPSTAYIQKMRDNCRLRLALAGVRMAAWLDDVLSPQK